jgi:hypothetical protein
MIPIDFSGLVEIVNNLTSAAIRLLVIVGLPASGKTRLITKLGTALESPLINLGKDASQQLLAMTVRQRKLKAEAIIGNLVRGTDHYVVCLDNTELLFDPALSLNPLGLLRNLARDRLVIATWNGMVEDTSLVYAYPDHPEYFKETVHGFPIVSVSEERLHFFLAP